MRDQLAIQQHGDRIWSIVALFYRSLVEYRRQYESYEAKVNRLARDTGIQREVLRLRAAELAGLLDFKRLEALRDEIIHELKDLCHRVFRTQDCTDALDRYVSDIFHEISILKEEHYTVKTYGPQYEAASADVELRYILDEAHTMFPQKLRQVLYLFGRAKERMEQHLPSFGSVPIVIRSLYLQQEGFVREAYPEGIRDFYRFMYPCGPFEGFQQVGMSFYHSGFFAQAYEAFELAEAEYEAALQAAHEAEAAAAANGASVDEEERVGALSAPTRQRLHALLASLQAKKVRVERTLAGEPPRGIPVRRAEFSTAPRWRPFHRDPPGVLPSTG